jgi:hypothetical protein
MPALGPRLCRARLPAAVRARVGAVLCAARAARAALSPGTPVASGLAQGPAGGLTPWG